MPRPPPFSDRFCVPGKKKTVWKKSRESSSILPFGTLQPRTRPLSLSLSLSPALVGVCCFSNRGAGKSRSGVTLSKPTLSRWFFAKRRRRRKGGGESVLFFELTLLASPLTLSVSPVHLQSRREESPRHACKCHIRVIRSVNRQSNNYPIIIISVVDFREEFEKFENHRSNNNLHTIMTSALQIIRMQ